MPCVLHSEIAEGCVGPSEADRVALSSTPPPREWTGPSGSPPRGLSLILPGQVQSCNKFPVFVLVEEGRAFLDMVVGVVVIVAS